MATEAELHVEDVKSTDDVRDIEIKDAENVKVEDSQALKAPATETQEVKADEVKNEGIEQVETSEPLENAAVEILENPKAELESTVLEPAVEADVDVVEKQVDEINFVEISKELINELAEDSVPNVDLQATSEKERGTVALEAAVEEVKAAEETSPIKASDNVSEPALIEATDEQVRTIEESIPNESKVIEEDTPIEVSENVLESATDNPVILSASAGIPEKDIDIPVTREADEVSGNILVVETKVDEVSKVEEIPENILETSATEEAEESTQITDSSAAVEVPKNLPETSTLGTTAEEVQGTVVPSEDVETVSKTDEKEVPEAVTEVKTADEISPIQTEAPTEETETTEISLPREVIENIIESVPEEAAENIEDSAPSVVDTAVSEVKSSEDITPVQVPDNVTVSDTTEEEKPVVTESSEKAPVSESTPETTVTESPGGDLTEEPKAVEKTGEQEKETQAEAVEEKKENSLQGLLTQEKAVVAEEPTLSATTEAATDVEKVDEVKETKDADTSLVEKTREVDVDNMVSEKTEKDDENTKESGEATQAEVGVKSPNQKSSNSIFTKMKHSIVKVKKAIIGKSPS